MSRIALIGSNGQLGSDIARVWPLHSPSRQGDELICLTHADIEVTDAAQMRSVLSGIRPDLVINTAAYLRVDESEAEAMRAFLVNALAVRHLAECCRDLGTTLVHFSTDYVFDGESRRPYKEADPARPISAYGISKLAGELFLRYVLPDNHILVRSSGFYGVAGTSGKGGNFVESMLRFAREGRPIRVVEDQVSSPTYTVDLAGTLLDLIERGGRGTFHITNAGHCSWFEFASRIFSLLALRPDFAPTTRAEYGAIARRPAFSVLENSRLKEIGLAQPRPWQEALADYLRLKGHRLAA